jgi:predicted ribosome quality control (RQC) complex YloA/Tae2 family protein
MGESEFRGYTIIVGKNENDNDHLITLSADDDYWLHLSDFASPHCIIKNPSGKRIHAKVINHAAYLTKKHSKYSHIKKVNVDVTRIKYISKTEKKGLVTVTNILKVIKI